MKNSLKLRISAIGAALTALGSSPHASALDPESPRKKRPTISHLRQLEVSSDPCDENELDFKLDLKTKYYHLIVVPNAQKSLLFALLSMMIPWTISTVSNPEMYGTTTLSL